MKFYLYIFRIFQIFFNLLSLTNIIKCKLFYNNPTTTYLSNENLFIIHQTGIDIINEETKENYTSLIFSDTEKITIDNLSKVVISKFDNDYIIAIINNKVYIFNEEGKFIFQSRNINYGKNPDFYSLTGVDCYNYYIAFMAENNILFFYYEYDIQYNITNLIASNIYYEDQTLRNSGISCHIMKHKTKGEVFTCFYIITYEGFDYFRTRFFTIDGGLITDNSYISSKSFVLNNVDFLKTDINSDQTKVFICFILSTGTNKCFYYDIATDSFSTNFNCNENICKDKYYGLKVNYFPSKNDFVFGCSGNNGNVTLCVFNEQFKYKKNEFKLSECDNIEGYSIIYPKDINDYYILSEEICSGISNSSYVVSSTYIEEETETNIETEYKLEKCEKSTPESVLKKLCISCNKVKGYYPLKDDSIDNNNEYIECVNNETKPKKFYFNKDHYEQCYERCASCEYGGNENDNNCTSCDEGYIPNPDFNNSNNCVIKCLFYYYNYYGKYKCTSSFQCPENYHLLIKEKEKCTNDCSKDDIYKFQYNGECWKECPNNTFDENNDFICKDINKDICSLTQRNMTISQNNIDIETMAKVYTNEFDYTDNHVSVFNDSKYIITFYKNKECISNLSLEESEIDFGECYEKVKSNYSIDDNLVLGIINEKNKENYYPQLVSFSMYNPEEGEKLHINNLCQNESVIVKENLFAKLNKNYNYNFIQYMINQNIDVFNLSSEFYTDICFHYDSPINKDITLKDRVSIFFPNITLCENGCSMKGVNSTEMRAICECKFNNLINNNILGNSAWYKNQMDQIQSFLSQTNIEIMKCFKEFFKRSYFIFSKGIIIIISFLVFEIILTIIYMILSKYPIIKYTIDLSDKFLIYQHNKNKKVVFEPLKKKTKRFKTEHIKTVVFKNEHKPHIKIYKPHLTQKDNSREDKHYNNKILITNIIGNSSFNTLKCTERPLKTNTLLINKKNNKISKLKNPNLKTINGNNFVNSSLKEYLKTDYEDMIFEDVMLKDKRKFSEYFIEKIKTNLLIVNSILIREPFKPIPIKLLLLILDIDLNFFTNALFFNEEFVSQIYHSEKKENFFSFIPRCIDRLFYTTIVGVIVKYLIEFFFVEEKRIKFIFKRVENITIIKREITKLVKTVLNRFIYFIITCFIITIFSLYHISCFNNIYPHLVNEWIKSSIFIIIIKHILSILVILFESFVRFMSFRFESEKLYKISLFLS